jgi:hypothetical protein
MRKAILIVGFLLSFGCIFAGIGIEYGPSVVTWAGWSTNEPVSMVVVLEETKTADKHRDIMMGNTANALRKAEKWNSFDKDQVPKDLLPLKELALKVQVDPEKNWKYWMAVLHGTKVTWSGFLPDTEKEFAERVQQQGGL